MQLEQRLHEFCSLGVCEPLGLAVVELYDVVELVIRLHLDPSRPCPVVAFKHGLFCGVGTGP